MKAIWNSELAAILFLALLALAGCAGNSQTAIPTAAVAATATTCSTGYVYSATYGCLAQSTCPSGYGLYNNSCVVLTTTSTVCPTGYTLYNNTCVVAATSAASTCQGSCSAGYTQTSYGCLPQYACQSCFGYSQGYCVSGAGAYYWLGY